MNSEKVFSCPFFNPLGFKLLSRIHTSPLAQACSLCPIQNSQFSPRPTCLTSLTHPTIQNSEFRIQNSQFPSHYLERIIGLKNAYLCDR